VQLLRLACVGQCTLLSHVAAFRCFLLQDAKAALDWLAAFHALWWEEVRTVFAGRCKHAILQQHRRLPASSVQWSYCTRLAMR
jgi:hypothetical protein